MSFPFRLILALATSSLWLPVRAATINVPACNMPGFPLASNSLNQSPCQVAGYLGAVCNNGSFGIDPIVAGFSYSNTLANNCTCSTVYYSVISACAASMLDSIGSKPYKPYSYPNPVPPQTAIPHWAFQSYNGPNATFNVANAVALGELPESAAPSSASSTSGPGASNTPASTSSSSGGKSEAGAIAGGVVGGLAFISLLAVGVVFYRRRRQENRSSEPILDGADMQMATPTPFVLPSSSSTPPLKLYNPSDPSTFPQSHLSQNTSSVHYRSLSDSTTGYTGNAEV
ncbi:hypothetical protein BDP27DRAFT_1326560 [Rhodocollybia butyracea]|uniref:Epidermal growth factor receptor-like transmembrane-juxtamembrane segment domain-containing protein n=1 Tax=Rhodocollybia butyracea TaxID=206335 RepID=A0A9P5PUI1_9AGAR|nr:hypothetical protein BDP27DRAFT_1326560 [Rhodocollybia butyracea]